MKNILRYLFLISLFFIVSQKLPAQKLAANPIVSGLTLPIDLKNCGDNRLFVAERPGRVHIIDADSTLRPIPFLDISSKISSYTNSEEGFLGIVFSPNYKTDGKFYVNYTDSISGQLITIIEEYKADPSDSSKALTTGLTILTQLQPFSNHNGGNLMFGKDGYLYINLGDGGSGGDPQGNGQNKNTFLGKILRIDVSNSSVAQPYVIPSSNPFYNDVTPGIKKEIWAYGVRNPWRSSVDRITGDLWIGDVGQNAVEEVDFQPVNATGGRNYGWNIMEGNSCYNPSTGCNMTGLTLPVYNYPHVTGGNSITGGYIYRSAQSKSLFGAYIFADYVQKWVDGIRESNGTLSGTVNHYITKAQATGNPVSFGEDRYGDQYILFNGNGTVYKLEDTSYLRKPKAYFTIAPGNGSFLFQGIEGRNLTYQWLKNDMIIPGATSPDYTTAAPGIYTLAVTNILNISDTSAPFTFGTLPLSITSFNAQKITGNKIQLQWSIASEQNISGYSIMRKLNNEANFSSIGFVESKSVNSISNNELDYTFTDSAATNNSKIFYRLLIQNVDGSYTYSDIRSITFNGIKNSFSFYPYPAKSIVQINIEDFDKPLVMVMYDNMGKKIKEQYLNRQNTKIDLSGLHGIYIVQLSDKDGNNLTRNKLVIE